MLIVKYWKWWKSQDGSQAMSVCRLSGQVSSERKRNSANYRSPARVSSGAPSSLEAAAACFWHDKPQFPYTLSFAMHSRSKSLPFQSMVVFPGRPMTLWLAKDSRLAYFLSDFLVYFLSDFAPILHQLQQSKSQLTMIWMCTIQNTTQCKNFQPPPNFRRILSLPW